MSIKEFSVKRPGETVTLSFRYTRDLGPGETLTSVQGVTASVFSGDDSSPAAILSGAPAVVGDRVLQQVTAGLAGVRYLMVALAPTSAGNVLQLEGILPVEAPG